MYKNRKIEIIITDEETGKTIKSQADTNLLQDLANCTTMEPRDIIWEMTKPLLEQFDCNE